MPKAFTGQDIEHLAAGRLPKGFPADVLAPARRKLFMVVNAGALLDLRSPPGNRLEALKGDRLGRHSIRINDKWRLCFSWIDGAAHDLEITDYHD